MYEIIKKENILRNIIITLGLTILPLQVLMLFIKNADELYYQSIVFIIVLLLSVLAIKIIGKPRDLTLKLRNIKMFFTKGWYIIVASFIFAILNFMSIDFFNITSISQILFFFINVILGVIFEELVFRGIIQNIIVEKYEVYKKSVWNGIIISSLIFAVIHLLNLIGQPYFILGTITQVIYTFCLGMLLGVVYYFSKNIWSVILLHFIFNVLGSYSTLFITNVNNSDISLMGAILQLIIMLPCIYAAFNIYRKNN